MRLKDIKLELKYFLFLLSLSTFVFLPISNVQAVSSTRYHAGYYGHNNPQGVKGTIFTEDSPPPIWELFAEWVNIRISYAPNYWVQLGYQEHWIWLIFFPIVTIDFYFERNDVTGRYASISFLKPVVGHTYKYTIYYQTGGLYCWHFNVYEWQNLIWGGDTVTNPQGYIGIEAFVETSVTSINIDGSHFSSLKYYTGSDWYLWTSYTPHSTGPYAVQPVYPYEFYAWGGG